MARDDRGASAVSWRLRYQGNDIPIGTGRILIGRSASSHIMLDDPMVSRRHAAVVADAAGVLVTDLGSANGVIVNGEKIAEARRLAPGDEVVIGGHLLQLVRGPGPAVGRAAAPTIHDDVTSTVREQPPVDLADDDAGSLPGAHTQSGNILMVLGTVADKMLALGQVEQADRVLSSHLANVLRDAKASRSVDDATVDLTIGYALKLAEAGKETRWVEFVFELCTVLGRLLPAETVVQLHRLLRSVPPMQLDVLRRYLEVLEARSSDFGPPERFLHQRIRGLEGPASSR